MTTPMILARRDLTPMQRVVLAMLHEHADGTGRVTMKQSEIAIRCGAQDSVLRRVLARLEGAGALCIERAGIKGTPQVLRLTEGAQAA